LERDDLPTAEKYLLEGIELSQRGGLQDDLSQGLVIRASLEYAQGDLDSALATIEQGTAIVDAYRVPRVVMLSAAYRARFQLAAGHVADALEWARQYQKTRSAQSVEYLREFEDLTLARVLLASREPKAASEIVDSVLAQAQATGRMRVCIEALVVQTLCYRAEKNTPAALDSLTQALQLAVPKGFIRLFVDEGQPLFELLSQVRSAVPDLLGKLFEKDLFDKQAVPALTVQLPEPLTDQERRVLGLLGLGMTNREIADELVISVGTAKWHVHNVLQKLDVDNRAQAVVRARELDIV
jgi:LuxR family maltose regulon positive regulatory protein